MQDHLLQSALSLMAQRGGEAVQIDDIVQAAGVARGTFYKYFDSTAALVRELALRLSEDLILTVNVETARHADPAMRAAFGMRAVLGLVAQCPQLGGFIARSGWPVSDPSHVFFRIVVPNLQDGLASGRFAPRPLALCEALMGGLAVGAMHALAQGHPTPDFAEAAAEMLLVGLGITAQEARALARQDLILPQPQEGTFLARIMGPGQS